MMTHGDHEGRVFLSILTLLMESFSRSPLNTSFYICKREKNFQKNPEYADVRHGDVILTLQSNHEATCGQHAADVWLSYFYFSHGLVRVHVR